MIRRTSHRRRTTKIRRRPNQTSRHRRTVATRIHRHLQGNHRNLVATAGSLATPIAMTASATQASLRTGNARTAIAIGTASAMRAGRAIKVAMTPQAAGGDATLHRPLRTTLRTLAPRRRKAPDRRRKACHAMALNSVPDKRSRPQPRPARTRARFSGERVPEQRAVIKAWRAQLCRRPLQWCLVWLFALWPARASAYCRESLSSQATGPCDPAPGVPFLYWQRSCLTYHLNDQIFAHIPLLPEQRLRAALDAAFASWADVNCRGKRPFLVVQAKELTHNRRSELLQNAQNESLLVARSGAEWASLPDHDPQALALTYLWFDKRNGEIADVDMELNARDGGFADCLVDTCSDGMVDLQNTVTHEAGHLLGLGHSDVPDSTMQVRTASASELDKRDLSDDDRDGYCALDLPEPDCAGTACTCPASGAPAMGAVSPLVGSCQLQPGLGFRASANGLWLAAAVLWHMRRAQTRTRKSK
jgi:hypothetical protein